MGNMKRRLVGFFAIVFVLALYGLSFCSSWSLTIGGAGDDRANAVQQATDGGYIVAGYTSSSGQGSNDAWVAKINANGSVVWQKTYGGTGDDQANAVQQTVDGGYIVAGSTTSFGPSKDAWVFKLDSNGAVVWQKTYGGAVTEYAYSIQQTSDGGYVVAGVTNSSGVGSGDAWVFKLDANGEVLWQNTYGNSNSLMTDYARVVKQTADGGYIVAGYSTSIGSGSLWVLKLNANGTIAWQKSYYDGGNAYDIRQTADGGYIIAGSVTTVMFGSSNILVLKINADGSEAWQKTYGGGSGDYSYSVVQTADGGYAVAGVTNSYSAGLTDAWVLKLNADGAVVWQKSYGGSSTDEARAIQQTEDGGFIIAGYSASFGTTGIDAWVLKLDQYGGIPGCSTVAIAHSGAVPGALTTAPVDVTPTVGATAVTTVVTGVSGVVSNTPAISSCFDNLSSKWQKAYGGAGVDSASNIKLTGDGGYIIAGYSTSYGTGNNEALALKLHADGTVDWQKTYSGAGNNSFTAMEQTTDGGYIAAGMSNSSGAGSYDGWVVKLGPDGSISWQKTLGRGNWDGFSSIQQTADGGYIAAGYTTPQPLTPGTDAWVVKLNADGTVAWQKTYGGTGSEYANSIQQTGDGGYIFAGNTSSFGTNGTDAWVVKLNADGTIAWQKTYGGTRSDQANSIQQTGDGGYIFAGTTTSLGTGFSDYAWVVKLNADGSVAWQKAYGGMVQEYANSIRQTGDGGYIFAGRSYYEAWIVKLISDGSIAWQKTYGGTGYDSVNAVLQTGDGGYVAVGDTDSFGAGSRDVWVLRLDENGGCSGCINIADAGGLVKAAGISVSTSGATELDYLSTIKDSTSAAKVITIQSATECSSNYEQYMIDIVMSGKGTGTVTSTPGGVNCTGDCFWAFSSGMVTLIATPDPLATFAGWTGACNDAGQVIMDSDKMCVATFNTPADFTGTPLYGGHSPLVVSFTDLSGNSPFSWLWDFGDGDTGYGSSPSHVYRLPGLYTITLTATGPGGEAKARKIDYVTVAPCGSKPVRIAGPLDYLTVAEAYLNVAGGGISLQASEFVEDIQLSAGKNVILLGGYSCDYGARIGDSMVRGSLTIGGSSGTVAVDMIAIY